MPEVFGFDTNAEVRPLKWTETTPGDFGSPGTGSWQPDGDAVPVLLLPMRSDEKVRAGIDTDAEARKLYFNLTPTGAPFTTRQTLEIGAARYNVKNVLSYDVAGFDRVGMAEIVRL